MFKLDQPITLEDIKNPEFVDKLSNFIHNGIDYYLLLSYIRPRTEKPVIELVNYNMASGSKEGYYNASVTIREKGEKYTGHAHEIKGLVNAAITAALKAIPHENIELSERNAVEIRMVSPTVEGLIEVIIRLVDKSTGQTYVGSFTGYDIMGACVHAFVDAVNQILNPEVRSHGLYRSFVNLIEDPATHRVIELKNGKIYFKDSKVSNTDIRAVFFLLRAIKGRQSDVKIYEILVEIVFQTILKNMGFAPASIITKTLESQGYARENSWKLLREYIKDERTEIEILNHFGHFSYLVDAVDNLGYDNSKKLLDMLSPTILDDFFKRSENISARLIMKNKIREFAKIIESLDVGYIEKLYSNYQNLIKNNLEDVINGMRLSFSTYPRRSYLDYLIDLNPEVVKNRLNYLLEDTRLIGREEFFNACRNNFTEAMDILLSDEFIPTVNKFLALTKGDLSYLRNDFREMFSRNPQYAFNLVKKLMETRISRIESLMKRYHLKIPLRNMPDFLDNVRLSFSQDTICNYCESNALNIVINGNDVASKVVKQWKLHPDPTGIPQLLGGNIVFNGFESLATVKKLVNERELDNLIEIHNSGLTDTFHKIGQKNEYRGPYPDKPALHRNKRGITIEREAIRQHIDGFTVITTGYGININAETPISMVTDETLNISGRYISAFGIGIKVHDVFDINDNYFGSRISLFTYNPYSKKLKTIRILSKNEARDLNFILQFENLYSIIFRIASAITDEYTKNPDRFEQEEINPFFSEKIKKAIYEGKDPFYYFKPHNLRYFILERVVDYLKKRGAFSEYLYQFYPFFTKKPIEYYNVTYHWLRPHELIKEKILYFYKLKRERIREYSTSDSWTLVVPKPKKIDFGTYHLKEDEYVGTMETNIPEYFRGITFTGIIVKNRFFLIYRVYKRGICESEHCISEEELFEVLFMTNKSFEKLAQLADGMKEIRKVDFFNKTIFMGTKSVLGLNVHFYVISDKSYIKNSAAYFTGETILKGSVISSSVPTIGRLNVIKNYWDLSTVQENDIVVVHELLPDVIIDLNKINGLIVEVGGRGSHSAIITNAKGIGLLLHEEAVRLLEPYDGKWVKFDAHIGEVRIVNKSEKIYRGEPIRGEVVIPGKIIEKVRYEEKIEPNETTEDYILLTSTFNESLIRFFSDSRLKGIISERGGRLAQIANFARSFLSIPIMTGFDHWVKTPLREIIEDGMIVQLDAENGFVTSPPEIIGNTDYYYTPGDIASASIIDKDGNEIFLHPKDIDEMTKRYIDDFSVVLSPYTPPEELRKYMDHPYRELRIAVAKHENCTFDILKHLAKDKSRTLRRIVREVTINSKKLSNEQKREILSILEVK